MVFPPFLFSLDQPSFYHFFPLILEWGITSRKGSCSRGNLRFKLEKRYLSLILGKSLINSVNFFFER